MRSWFSGKRSIDQLVEDFITAGAKVPDIVGPRDVSAYERADGAMRKIAAELRSHGAEGDAALLKLMDNSNVVVRMRAAAACLETARDQAVNLLADICDLRAGKISMDAMHALLFAGEFDMKTGPKRR